MHIIDTIAAEHETLARITSHLANGENTQAKAELSEMIWRLAGAADTIHYEHCSLGAGYEFFKKGKFITSLCVNSKGEIK